MEQFDCTLKQPKALDYSVEEEATRLIRARYKKRVPLAFVHSYGCQQNVSDGEHLKGILAQLGYGFTDEVGNADLIVLNTCAVRENAEDRVFGNVGALKGLKRRNPDLMIVLCGCMTQQNHVAKKLEKSFPQVDIVFGANAVARLPALLCRALSSGRRVIDLSAPDEVADESVPVQRDGKIKAWLPIMQGCDNFCTYCIVPYVRGRERSRKMENILEEARGLITAGYREITLLGQNVNSYGKGLPDASFVELLKRLDALPGDFRLRFMTSHPKDCTPLLIDTIAQCEKVCHHIHLPVQSGSNRILQLMNRHYTVEQYEQLVDYARKKIPDVHFTSDIIVGFPGETYEDFSKTLELIRRVRFTSLFTFIYSKRSGTRAAEMEDLIPAQEKSRWFRELLKEQEQIGHAIHEAQVGKTLRVLAEERSKTPGFLHGHTSGGIITEFMGDESLCGTFVQVKITKALNWAILGEIKKED